MESTLSESDVEKLDLLATILSSLASKATSVRQHDILCRSAHLLVCGNATKAPILEPGELIDDEEEGLYCGCFESVHTQFPERGCSSQKLQISSASEPVVRHIEQSRLPDDLQTDLCELAPTLHQHLVCFADTCLNPRHKSVLLKCAHLLNCACLDLSEGELLLQKNVRIQASSRDIDKEWKRGWTTTHMPYFLQAISNLKPRKARPIPVERQVTKECRWIPLQRSSNEPDNFDPRLSEGQWEEGYKLDKKGGKGDTTDQNMPAA